MGMLRNLTESVGKSLFGEAPDLEAAKLRAEAREADRLRRIEEQRKREAKFLTTEGQGLRRFAKLSFGNTDELQEESEDRQSLRRSGRFAKNRLVL